jgi:hypothetical protein
MLTFAFYTRPFLNGLGRSFFVPSAYGDTVDPRMFQTFMVLAKDGAERKGGWPFVHFSN